MLVWWVLTSTIKAQEAVVGLAVAAIAASVMTVVRGRARPLVRVRLRWLAPAWRWPALAVRDTASLVGVLWRQLVRGREARGSFREIPMALPGDESEAAGKELAVTLAISSTPNTIVVGFDRDREVLVVHQAVPRRLRSVREIASLR